LQADLSPLGYQIIINGNFDESRENVVKKFQQYRSITVDGIVGAETGRHLEMALLISCAWFNNPVS
jgi:peptidoglycan hydrolase-like protein with peptidoglycan-binding domain